MAVSVFPVPRCMMTVDEPIIAQENKVVVANEASVVEVDDGQA